MSRYMLGKLVWWLALSCVFFIGSRQHSEVQGLRNVFRSPEPTTLFIGCRYRSEVQRLRNVFRSAVAGDVARLKEAVGEYKENTSRLECQKQLLLKQVHIMLLMNICSVLH